MLPKLLAATVLLPLSWAFYDTVPLVAWSSHENALISALNEQRHSLVQGGFDALDAFRGEGEGACEVGDVDVLVVIEQPGLHATDLRRLAPDASVPSRLKKARSAAQVPYVRRRLPEASGSEDASVSEMVERLAGRCSASMAWVSLEGVEEFIVSKKGDEKDGERYVVYVSLPEVYGEGAWRRGQMAELEESLNRALTELESAFPKHLFIYTGSLSSSSPFSKRQSSSDDEAGPFPFAPSNSTLGTGTGILAHYQLLTPGLILSLFIAFFVLLPALLVGVRALAGIESSVRLEAPKGPSQGKKNQ